jgi:RHS repeat-associated protein
MAAYVQHDTTKTLAAEYRYDAFGNLISSTTNEPAFLPRFTFSTKEYLAEAQLYLYAYRVYDPVAGRWTQRDPVDYEDSPNLYQFCGNNPVNGWDPLGSLDSITNVTQLSFTNVLPQIGTNSFANAHQPSRVAARNAFSEIQRNGGTLPTNAQVTISGERITSDTKVTWTGVAPTPDGTTTLACKQINEPGVVSSAHFAGEPSLNETVKVSGGKTNYVYDVDKSNPQGGAWAWCCHVIDAVLQKCGQQQGPKVREKLDEQQKKK